MANVRFGSLADIEALPFDVRFTPKSGHCVRADHVRFVPIADIQAGFGYYCRWARVLKFAEHHP